MPIPNFTLAERKAFLEAVEQSQTPSTLSSLTSGSFGDAVESYGSSSDSMPVLTSRLFVWLAPQTDKLILFLDALLAKMPSLPQGPILRAQSARLKQIVAIAAEDPIDACLIDAVIMVNRAQLRATLRNSLNGFVRPVIVVSGPPRSGRSHSWHLIRHVARAYQVPARIFDLDAWIVEQRTLQHLFDRIVSALSIGAQVMLPTITGAQPETIGARYADAIVEVLAQRVGGSPDWLIFDSVDRPLAPEITAFLRRLCERRLGAAFQDCTLFLLGDSAQLAAPEGYLTAKESLTGLLPAEIAQAAHEVNSLGTTRLADAALGHRVNAIMQEVGACPSEECAALVARRLTQLRQEVGAP